MGKVNNTNKAPYCSIGLLDITLEDDGGGWGTGALISDRYVLTCGHNLYYEKKFAAAVTFYPGYSGGKNEPSSGGLKASTCFVAKAYVKNSDKARGWDIGVIRLEKSVDAKYMGVAITEEDDQLTGVELQIAGYPGVKHFQMWEDQQLVAGASVEHQLIAYQHQSAAGSSGSPMFHPKTLKIHAVHGGLIGEDDKTGVLIMAKTHKFIEKAMKVKSADYFITQIE
jgi:V8-like Glu-specific endopeptidase